jgi:hypothetical protein
LENDINPQKTAGDLAKNPRSAVESLFGCPQHMIDWLKVNLKAASAAQQVSRIASLFLTSR